MTGLDLILEDEIGDDPDGFMQLDAHSVADMAKRNDFQRLIQGWHTFALGQVDRDTRPQAKTSPVSLLRFH